MMSTFGNNSNFDENLILSLPAALANNSRVAEHNINENLNPITSQNYAEKYKDLENVLADEKKTNEELQKYYKVLKADHSRIKNETYELKSQMQNLVEENKVMQDKYKAMFEKLQQELRRKQLFIEELKTKELDEVKLERLKEELSQQIESPYKDIVRQLEQELQKLQSECNRIRQDSNVLRSSNEHERTEHHNYLEQIKLKQEIELNALRKDRDMLRQKLQENNQAEALKIREVIRENNQFKIKIKSLVEENEELRERLDHIESHNNSLIRNHSKLISDLSTKISVLESEKESLKQQADNSYKECVNLQESLANTVRKLHDTERENTSLKLKFDEVQHNCKRDLANLKLEMVRERGERNREKEALNNNIQDLILKIEIANNNVELQKKLVEEKDRELTKTINGVNEENWTKINELTNEKIDLESRIQLLNKDFEFKLSTLQVEKDKSDDRLKSFESQREEIFKENTRLRGLIIDSDNLRSELEKEQEKSRELSRKCNKLETELSSNSGLEQELTEINLKLKNEVLFYGQEVQCLKEQIKRLREEYENRLMEIKTDHVSERNDFNFKNQDLQSKLNRALEKINEFKQTHEKKKKKFQTYAKAIKMKAEALNAKMKEIQLKEQSMNQMVPMQAYNKLKAHLDSITSRHQAFREVIIQGENYSSSNIINKTDQALKFHPTFEKRHQTFMPIAQTVSQSNFGSPRNNKVFESEKKCLIDLIKIDPYESDKNELESRIEEITNRIDNLQSEQKDKLKTNSKNTIENMTMHSIDKSLSQSPDIKSQARTPSPDKSKKSTAKTEEYIDPFEPFADELNQKELEVKKLSYSSSSSSSISNLLQENAEKIAETKSKNEENIDEKHLNIQNEEESISYEEDFENSAKSSSSDNDDF